MSENRSRVVDSQGLRKFRAFLFLLLLAISMMGAGTFLGNPFETYQNGSTL